MLKPLLSNIIVQTDPKKERTAGGIYIPEPSQGNEPVEAGMVIDRGSSDLKNGERILYSKMACSVVEKEGSKYRIIATENIYINISNPNNMTPLHDRVVVKPSEQEEVTKGGIIIPDNAKEKPLQGTVIAAGPGKIDEPMTVKKGDTVLYGKYVGTEVTIEETDYLIMKESDILAIL